MASGGSGQPRKGRDGGRGRAPHRTAGRIPPGFPCTPRAAVMPQDRRSPLQTTQHTAQAPIVQPQRRSRSRSVESDRGRGNPAHVRPSSRPERRNPGRSGSIIPPIPPAIGDPHLDRDELGPRGSPAVLRPLARPNRDLCSRQVTEPTRDEPGPIPSPFPGEIPSRPPPLTTRTPAYFLSPVAATIRSDAGPIPPTSGRLWFCEDAGSRSPHQCAGAPTTPPQAPALEPAVEISPSHGRLQQSIRAPSPPSAATHLLIYSLTHSPTHPLTHPLTHSPTHSPTHPLTHPAPGAPPTHPPTIPPLGARKPRRVFGFCAEISTTPPYPLAVSPHTIGPATPRLASAPGLHGARSARHQAGDAAR